MGNKSVQVVISGQGEKLASKECQGMQKRGCQDDASCPSLCDKGQKKVVVDEDGRNLEEPRRYDRYATCKYLVDSPSHKQYNADDKQRYGVGRRPCTLYVRPNILEVQSLGSQPVSLLLNPSNKQTTPPMMTNKPMKSKSLTCSLKERPWCGLRLRVKKRITAANPPVGRLKRKILHEK